MGRRAAGLLLKFRAWNGQCHLADTSTLRSHLLAGGRFFPDLPVFQARRGWGRRLQSVLHCRPAGA